MRRHHGREAPAREARLPAAKRRLTVTPLDAQKPRFPLYMSLCGVRRQAASRQVKHVARKKRAASQQVKHIAHSNDGLLEA